MKALLLSTAIATLAMAGAATAKPYDMSRDQADQVTAAALPEVFKIELLKQVLIQELKQVKEQVEVKQRLNLKGNFAKAEAAADAKGKNTKSETLTDAKVIQGRSSASFSDSEAAAVGDHRPPRHIK